MNRGYPFLLRETGRSPLDPLSQEGKDWYSLTGPQWSSFTALDWRQFMLVPHAPLTAPGGDPDWETFTGGNWRNFTGPEWAIFRGATDEGTHAPPLCYLPLTTLVDFGCLMGIRSGYQEGVHSVWLNKVRRSMHGTEFLFHFQSDAPGLANKELVFLFSLDDPKFMHQYQECSDLGEASFSQSISEGYDCVNDSLWSGHLVLGDLTLLSSLVAPGETMTDLEPTVEPALIRSLVKGYARSLNLANGDRTRATSPPGCRELCWDREPIRTHVRNICLTGHIRFRPGYNCEIRQDSDTNAIIIGALDPKTNTTPSLEGQPCDEVPLFEGETPPQGRSRLDGALACHEVIRSVNGVGGRILQIIGGSGVNITPLPETSTIIVDINMHDMAVCAQEDEDDPEDEHCASESISYDPCHCGPDT